MRDRSIPLRIALTGGIASGKSAVAGEFAALGVPIFDTDQIARDVVEPGTPALAQLVATFGAEILDASGRMDRRRMRERVFADASQRQQLEAITHPAIREELARRASASHYPYQIHAIPLLVEGGRSDTFDRVLVVDCPEEAQLARVMQRDEIDAEQARRILAAQANRSQRLAVADDVIVNTGALADLRNKVRALHAQYLALADQRT
ncbi:MAG: dephospho-CoA kinase [Candidatus Obscuribacterales bacterium]|nr:dephospho-CoA kinase [Steroidobacteraceae bacterium]